MATVQRPEERYVEFDEYIDLQLDKARNGIKWTDILAAVAGIAALVIGYLVLFVAADHWFFPGGIPRSLRIVALVAVAVISVAWLGFRVVWPYLRQVNDLYAARMLEESEPGLRGSLFGLVDLRRAGREPADEVRRALEKRAATVLSDVDVEASLDRRPLLRTSYALLAVVLIACIYAVASPKRVGPSLARALFPTSAVNVATRTEIIEVKPGDVSVLAGTQLDVSVMIRGEAPERVMLFYSTGDRRFADEPVELRLHDETTREYRAALIGDAGRGLTQDLSYRIEANDDAAGPFTVKVEQPPVATVTSITLQHPPYTGLEPAVRDTPPIDAIEGTKVSLAATANRPLKSAKLVFADDERFLARGEEVPMQVAEDGVTLTANWLLAIRSDGTSPTHYRIECRDTAGKTNPNPAVYPIAIRPDLPPEVVLHDPKSDLERPANAIIPLLVSARDPDFELRELTLRLERQGQELPERTVLWEGHRSEANVRHEWELGPLGLKPGDVVTFYIQARDNREPEFNRRNTPKLNITITEPVAKEQVEQQLAEDRKRQDQELAEADRNTTAQDRERQPEGADADPTAPAETNTEPTDDGGEQPEGAKGDGSETPGEMADPANGEGQEQADSKVNNDGTADDVALRELLEHQRQQEDAPPQPQDGKPQDGEPQDGKPQDGEPDQRAEETQEGGKNGGAGQKQSPDGQKSPAGESSRQASGDSTGNAGDKTHGSSGEDGGNARPESGDANERMQQERPPKAGDSPKTPGAESSSQGAESSSEAKPGQEMTGRSEEGTPGDAEASGSRNEGSGRTDQSTAESSTDSERTTEQERSAATDSDGSESQSTNERTATGETKPAAGEQGSGDEKPMPPGPDGGAMKGQPKSSDAESGRNPSATGENPTQEENRQPRTSDQQPGATQPQAGEGHDEQRTPRPDSGERGTGQPNPNGTPSQQPGESDMGTQPGSSQSSDGKPQQDQPPSSDPSAQSQEMTDPGASNSSSTKEPSKRDSENQSPKGQSGEGQSGKGEGQSGKGEGQSGKGEGQSGKGEGQSGKGEGQSGKGEGQSGKGEGQSGKGEGQSGKGEGQSGKGEGQSGQGKGGSGGQASQGGGGGTASGTGAGGGSTDAAAEEANADYARQATDLALKKLEDELDRGEVDPELLKDLGWTEEDMRRFADRLRRNLAEPTGDESPQQIAERKEFEHMLENLRLDTGPAARTAPTGRVEDVGDVNTANPLVPSEYRDAYEAFTRSVAGRREAGGGKQK